ncbi:MAG: hypothetical protein IKU07_06935 [Oscillospiraceae bacterium]|nr:hypothetical protein [Oscillospiraceae bacterium]
MKKETTKKSKLGLWLAIGIAALVLIVGAVLGIVLMGGQEAKQVDDGRPDLYWNLDREIYFEKGAISSSREMAEDGFFHIRYAYDGQIVELLTADKQLVNYIDTMAVMGIVLDGDGYIVDAVAVKEMATVIGEDVYAQEMGDGVLTFNSSVVMNGLKKSIELTERTKIYDVTTKAEVQGAEIALEKLGVMDKLSVYGNAEGEITHVYVTSHPKESKVYWRANQFVSSSKTTRVPDENGYYTIPFYCEGEYVEFKCKDVVEVNYIDKQSFYSCHFGLVFDEEGYIIEAIHSYEAIRGMILSERYDVTAIDGNTISTTKIIGSNAGATESFVLPENCPIYDVSYAAKSEDRAGKQVDSLSVGDRIVCFADATGTPLFVYVAEHVVEEAVWCYNVTRKYDSTLLETTREPVNGWYEIEIFTEGKIMTVRTKDKSVATEIDSVGAQVCGLTLNGNEIVDVYNVYSVFGYSAFGQGRYITSVSGSIFACFRTSAPDKLISGIMHPECKVWNLSAVGTYGTETKLQPGDYVYAYQNPSLQVLEIFVIRRQTNLPVYYGLERKYNSTKKETTREPIDGWYYYDVMRNGKLMTVKTNSKAMATKIDAINPAVFAMNVGSDGVVYEVYEGRYATGGYRRAHGYTVTSISGNTVETSYKNADGTIATRTLTLADDCKTVNMTTLAATFAEPTTVRVGDTITAFTDMYDKTTILAIRSRKVDYLYWNKLRLYDDENAVSLRELDAEGYYVYTLSRSDGKVVTLKTKDKAVADKVDYYGGAFTLAVKDDIITKVGSPSYAKNTNGTSLLNYDVTAVNGRKITLQKGEETMTITLSSDCKVFEVGPDAANFGAKVSLKVGDRVRAYKSMTDETYTYVYIRYHASRDKGLVSMCDVCKKEVRWEPWVGGSFSTAGGHFYLPADITTTYLPCSTGRSTFKSCTVCLDLNGHTYTRLNGRAMYVYTNATLNIMDTVGGGAVSSSGINTTQADGTVKGATGGVLGIPGGTVNLYGGTLRLEKEHPLQKNGGVVYVSKGADDNKTPGTFNMYGGKIADGETVERGGNIYVTGAVFNMYGGEVTGGKSGDKNGNGGGNIFVVGGGTMNLYGGKVTNGVSANTGGNILVGTGFLNVYGGEVTGGTAPKRGNDIYVYYSASNATVQGGKIGNFSINDQAAPTRFSGNPVIERLDITSGKYITLGEMTDGAKIAVDASGVFTTELADANAYEGIVVPYVEGAVVNVDGNKLSIRVPSNIETETRYCEICQADAEWGAWDGAATYGHFFLEEDITLEEVVQIPAGDSFTLDLAGHKVINEATRTFYIYGDMKVMDSATGGEIQGASTGDEMLGGVIRVNGGNFDLYSGTLRYIGTSVKQGGVLYMQSGATANLRGGVLTDGISTERGGNITVNSGYLTISGATVQNGTANSSNANGGGNIFVLGDGVIDITGGKVVGGYTTKTGGNILVGTGTLKVSGGEISGGDSKGSAKNVFLYYSESNAEITGGTIETLYYKDAESVKMSGNPVIGCMDIAAGKLIELGEMTEGANVKVSATEVFTTAFDGAALIAEKGYISAYSVSKVVSVVDNQLAVTDPVVEPDPSDPSDPSDEEETAMCQHCNTEVVWAAWNGTATDGHFYLNETMNVTAIVNVPAGDVLVLDLRGKAFNNTATRAFYVYGELAIMDTVGGGEVTGCGSTSDTVGGVIRVNGGKFDLYSGTVRYTGTSAKQGGVLYMQNAATVNLRGGVIADGITTERGGNIYVAGGSLTVCGATVQNGTAISTNANGGGNIFALGSSTVTISDGKVIDGYTSKTGGNICVGTATLIVTGGEISGGKADKAADNVYVYYNVGSNAEITGGNIESLHYAASIDPMKLSGNPVIGSLYIASGKVIELGQLTEGAKIQARGEGVFTLDSDYAEEALEKGYIYGTARQVVELDGKKLVIDSFAEQLLCQHCNASINWSAWDGAATDGHFYLTADVALTEELTLEASHTLVLDLNGYNITSAARVFSQKAGSLLAITDSVGNGKVIGKGVAAKNGGVISITDATFHLYGGTMALAADNNGVNRGGVMVTTGTTANVTLHGGVIENGVTTERGGNIYVGGGSLTICGATVQNGTAISTNANGGGNIFALGSSTVTVSDGKVIGGYTSKTGGNICVGTATLIVTGGEISGGKADKAADNVYVYYNVGSNAEITGGNIESLTYTDSVNPVEISGNPVIGLLEIASGKTIVLGELTEGADITVNGEGVFTTAHEHAADYVAAGWLKAVEGKTLDVADNAVSIAAVQTMSFIKRLLAAIF